MNTTATMWIGDTRTVPVLGFDLRPERSVMDLETPKGTYTLTTAPNEVDNPASVMNVQVHDDRGTLVFACDSPDSRTGQHAAARFLDRDWR